MEELTSTTYSHLHTLAAEYVDLVTQMRSGQYTDDAERRELSSQRTLVHDELLRLTGRTRDDTDMYLFCRALLAGHLLPEPEPGSQSRGHGH